MAGGPSAAFTSAVVAPVGLFLRYATIARTSSTVVRTGSAMSAAPWRHCPRGHELHLRQPRKLVGRSQLPQRNPGAHGEALVLVHASAERYHTTAKGRHAHYACPKC